MITLLCAKLYPSAQVHTLKPQPYLRKQVLLEPAALNSNKAVKMVWTTVWWMPWDEGIWTHRNWGFCPPDNKPSNTWKRWLGMSQLGLQKKLRLLIPWSYNSKFQNGEKIRFLVKGTQSVLFCFKSSGRWIAYVHIFQNIWPPSPILVCPVLWLVIGKRVGMWSCKSFLDWRMRLSQVTLGRVLSEP